MGLGSDYRHLFGVDSPSCYHNPQIEISIKLRTEMTSG